MSNEEFEDWARDNGMSISPSAFRIGTFSNQGTEMAFRAWQARQPEIDGLKAEVERLRKDLGARQKLDDPFKGRKTRIDGADIGIPCFDESAPKETK